MFNSLKIIIPFNAVKRLLCIEVHVHTRQRMKKLFISVNSMNKVTQF